MILSDRDIRKQIESGRLVIEPFEPDMVQPSSIDLRVDDTFRVFRNTRYPYIEVRSPMKDLTDVVKVPLGEAFILHPGVRPREHARTRQPPRRSRGSDRRKELSGPARPAHPFNGRTR